MRTVAADPGAWTIIAGDGPVATADRYRLLPEPAPLGADVFVAHMRLAADGVRLPASLPAFFQFYEERVADDVALGRVMGEKFCNAGGWVEYPSWVYADSQFRMFSSFRKAYEGELVAIGEEEWVKSAGVVPSICYGNFIANSLGAELMERRDGLIPTAVINGERWLFFFVLCSVVGILKCFAML